MGKNSLKFIKLTSITFLFQFLNSFSFYLPIFILFLIKLNASELNSIQNNNQHELHQQQQQQQHRIQNKQPLIELNDEYINNLYFKSLVKQDIIQIKFSINTSISLIELQTILNRDNVKYSKSIEITGYRNLFRPDLNQTSSLSSSNYINIIELFFPHQKYGHRIQIEREIREKKLRLDKFHLDSLIMSSNGLNDNFFDGFSLKSFKPIVHSTIFSLVLTEYFRHLRLLKLSDNELCHLERKHLELFSGSHLNASKLETLLLDNNQIRSIRHDTFYDLKNLKHIDLSNNRIKILHPLTYSFESSSSLNLINLRNNHLKALFKTASTLNNTSENFLTNLKYLYLNGNNDLKCDCGLVWLYEMKNRSSLNLDNFKCDSMIEFNSIESVNYLLDKCSTQPNLIVNTTRFEQTSEISFFRQMSKKWFAWTVFVDHLPVTTPFPYLMSNDLTHQTLVSIEQDQLEYNLNNNNNNQEKHVFHSWLLDDAIFDCSNKNSTSNLDESNSAIIWKTQYGYLSYLDEELMSTLDNNDYMNETEASNSNKTSLNSFKIFYKMNHLTKIYKNLTVKIGSKFGSETRSHFYVNNKNQLIVTNMRQLVSGPFVCLSINERGVNTYEYDILVRTGVSEYFIYSLFVSVISMIIPSIIGIIVCCICEYQADKNYPMTPPCYPTPMVSTPPNFDFNEWMANAASYFPNLNIHETLEQVSKRLRKGMEKASVTVKSLGMTSSAYIYSMYEQSSQRLYDLKQYVPTLNVPTINLNLPTMKYPPTMGQLANRMRMGMGNMFIQVREFCGTSDLLSHTVSMADIQSDFSASNAIGKTYIMDQFNLEKAPNNKSINQYNFNKLILSLIKEEAKANKRFNMNINEQDENEADLNDKPVGESSSNETIDMDDIKPSTSGLNTVSSKSSHIPSLSHLNRMGNSEDYSDDDDDDEAVEQTLLNDKHNFKKEVNLNLNVEEKPSINE